MSYESIIKMVAAENNTTPEEVDKEIRFAIKAAGLDVTPEVFIAMSAIKVKSEMNKQNGRA